MMSRGTLQTLAALYENQPATCRLIGVARGYTAERAKSGLLRLYRLGLATREKEPVTNRSGRQPYRYSCTEEGALIGEPLARALRHLHTFENGGQLPTSSTWNNDERLPALLRRQAD